MLTLEIAQRTQRCRICEQVIAVQDAPLNWWKEFGRMVYTEVVILCWGQEFAHLRCLEEHGTKKFEIATEQLKALRETMGELDPRVKGENLDGMIFGIAAYIGQKKAEWDHGRSGRLTGRNATDTFSSQKVEGI